VVERFTLFACGANNTDKYIFLTTYSAVKDTILILIMKQHETLLYLLVCLLQLVEVVLRMLAIKVVLHGTFKKKQLEERSLVHIKG
jgi:hypothetical protein